MTIPTNPPREVLKPCPFCGVKLTVYSEAEGYYHPLGNCVLSDFEMPADGYSEDRWQTRKAAEASTHIDPAFVLPCDVKLPPATTIKAGCDLKTLMTALSLEGRPIEFPERRPAEASAEPGAMSDNAKLQITLMALSRCEKMIEEALPQFNWDASALSADSIKLLNEVPLEVRRALQAVMDASPRIGFVP